MSYVGVSGAVDRVSVDREACYTRGGDAVVGEDVTDGAGEGEAEDGPAAMAWR